MLCKSYDTPDSSSVGPKVRGKISLRLCLEKVLSLPTRYSFMSGPNFESNKKRKKVR